MIGLLHVGSGDARPLERAFQEIGAPVEKVDGIDRLSRSAKVVVTGGGPFAECVRDLRDRRLVGPLRRAVLEGRPYLGVGFGLHLLVDVSHEAGQHTGLGLVAGKTLPLETDFSDPVKRQFKVPNVGWAPVHWTATCPLMNGVRAGESFFFNHTAHAQPLDDDVAVGFAKHADDIVSIVWSGNIFATQFLPERSQDAGRRVLENFAKL